MNYQLLLEQVKQFVTGYFDEHREKKLFYHNCRHTEDVVAATMQIANHYQLDDRDFFIVNAAAWFHDTGYMEDIGNHEEYSARLAEDFLKTKQVDAQVIEQVKQCIMATHMPQQPNGLLQQIICDADLFHLGMDNFDDKNNKLRKELKATHNLSLSKQEWRSKTIQFMTAHHYHTDYAQLLLNDSKDKNLNNLKEKQAQWDAENNVSAMVVPEPKEEKPASGSVFTEKVSKKKERPDKGIETMFRVSSSNHQRLSDMADNKAHIMITVNSIILSAIISLLLRRLEDYSYLIVPTFIILVVSLSTMIFAILATRPHLPEGVFTQQDVNAKKVNLLFFGNFYRMSLQDYIGGMRNVMADREYLYGSLIIDVYSQGVVLGRKYRLLRISYNIFMFGLIASVLAFIIAAAINGSGQ